MVNARPTPSCPARQACSLNVLAVDDVAAGVLEPVLDLVVMVNLRDIAAVRILRSGLGEIRPRPGNPAFLVSSGSQQHADEVQALSLGAKLLPRRETCFRQLRRILSVSDRAPVPPRQAKALAKARGGEAILKTGKTLSGLFGSFTADAPIALGEIEQFGAEVVGSVAEVGADAWLASVRDDHEGTFQHCPPVTATAASFAKQQSNVVIMQRGGCAKVQAPLVRSCERRVGRGDGFTVS